MDTPEPTGITISITSYEWFGNDDPYAVVMTDTEATIENFARLMRERVGECYPDATVEVETTNEIRGQSVKTSFDWRTWQDERDGMDNAQDVIDRIAEDIGNTDYYIEF